VSQENDAAVVGADLQDPLPESSFFYRRVFSYIVSLAFIALLAFVIYRMDEARELRLVAQYLCILLFCVITYYMIAPSAEQIVKMFQTARVLVRGVDLKTDDPFKAERPPSTARTNFEPERDAAPTSRQIKD
jgi:hypothetical protein